MEELLMLAVAIIVVFALKGNMKKKIAEQEKKSAAARVDAQISQTSIPAAFQERSNKTTASRNNSGVNYPSRPIAGSGSRNSTAAIAAKPMAEKQNAQKKGSAAGGKEEMSTTEMLAEKARLDQLEHKKEEFEQKQHDKKYYSGYNYARRYMLGDAVKPTEKLVYCPNCAAENLMKIHENPAKYNCYFCRAKLEG